MVVDKYRDQVIMLYTNFGTLIGECKDINFNEEQNRYYIKLNKPRVIHANVVNDPNSGQMAVGVLLVPLYSQELEIELDSLVIGFPVKEFLDRYLQETTSLAISRRLPDQGRKQGGVDLLGGGFKKR